jgi:hypothetical protein
VFWLTANSEASARTDGNRSPGCSTPLAHWALICAAICRMMGIPDDVSTRIRTIQASTDYTTITVFTELSRVAASKTAFQAERVAMHSVLELSTTRPLPSRLRGGSQ